LNRFELAVEYPGFQLAASAQWDDSCAALFGASGSGKSTLVEALLGLRPEVCGDARLAGVSLAGLAPHERGLGWVPQDACLFEHLSVRENVEFTAKGVGGPKPEVIEALEIGDLMERATGELSGGERSRVAIARALAGKPRMLLLDEPLASIDRPLRSRVVPFLQGLAKEGLPLLLVTHDPMEVLALAQVVFVLERGRIVQSGHPRDVFASAANFGSLAALGAENCFPVKVVERPSGTWVVETPEGQRLTLVRVAGFDDPSAIAVRAEDVMLMGSVPEAVSAQNVFEAEVCRLEPIGEQVLVCLQREESEIETWRVKVTHEAVRKLALAEGKRAVLLIKAHAVHSV